MRFLGSEYVARRAEEWSRNDNAHFRAGEAEALRRKYLSVMELDQVQAPWIYEFQHSSILRGATLRDKIF